MIFNTGSNTQQDSSNNIVSSFESNHLYAYTDFKSTNMIKNMFIDKDGSLCKRNSIKTAYKYTGVSSIGAYYSMFNTGDSFDSAIYFIEDSDLKTSEDKAYVNAIHYNNQTGKYEDIVTKLSLPAPTKNYKFFTNNTRTICAIGNGKLYGYDHLTASSFKTIEPYIPLIERNRTNLGVGTKYEDENLLTNKVRATYIADGSSRDYRIPEQVSVDAVYVRGNKLAAGTDYSVRTAGIYTYVTTTATYSGVSGDNELLEIYYTRNIDKDTSIKYPNGIANVACNGASILCLYTDTCIYLSGYSDCKETKFNSNQLYFPESVSSKIDLSTLRSKILGIAPLNNNKFAVITQGGSIVIYKISQVVLGDELKYYSNQVDALNVYNDTSLLNSDKKLFASSNYSIYIAYQNFIKCFDIDNDGNVTSNNITFPNYIMQYLKSNNISLNNYDMYYNGDQNYLYIYNAKYNTIVCDLNNYAFYIYDGGYKIKFFITDSIFVAPDGVSFEEIQSNSYGTEDTSYITGIYLSKTLNLGSIASAKMVNQIALKTESQTNDNSAINANAKITLNTDTQNTISITNDLINAKTNIPIVSSYNSDEYDICNDVIIQVDLPSNIYKLDSIIFDRDILDEIVPSK